MEFYHSPAPWTATREGDEQVRIVDANGTVILDGCGCCGSPSMANVNNDLPLMLASPALLTACIRVANLSPHAWEIDHGVLQEIVAECRAAVALAEGVNK
jgi:Fe-S oxidoreductase